MTPQRIQLRAITVRQPWAWAIVFGGKDVENRSRNIVGKYRGPVAIHAAKAWAPEAFDYPNLARLLRDQMGITRSNAVHASLDTSAIIGVVDIVGVHEERPYWRRESCDCSDWGEIDCWHLQLANPQPLLIPVPCKGKLGFWTVPEDIADRVSVVVSPTQDTP